MYTKNNKTYMAGTTLIFIAIIIASLPQSCVSRRNIDGEKEIPFKKEEKIEELICQLGSNDWAEREEAQQALEKIGALAESPLRRSLSHPDPEVVQRIKKLLYQIEIKKQGKIAFIKAPEVTLTCGYIWLMDADGGNQTNLTEAMDIVANYICWSPDGKKIAYQSREDEDHEIFTLDIDNKKITRLIKTNNKIDDTSPSWSPDGQKIAFTSERNGPSQIYVMDISGQNQIRLTNDKTNNDDPRWSPDGKKISYVSTKDGNAEIYVMDTDGKDKINLTNNKSHDYWPSWSPDGKKIAFVSTRDGWDNNAEIYVMDADGKNQMRLTNNKFKDSLPCWSFNGKKIVFITNRDRGERGSDYHEIYVMDADGKNQTRLTKNGGFLPIWQPVDPKRKEVGY
ncbi:MAG: DPP IV N-terminal domain-containing protein [Planctomycetota bacterium]